jgi:DNA-binding NtrC family response regulator
VTGRAILCIEDDALVLEVTRIPLEQHGYRVQTAANGGAAISLLEQTRDDVALVLLDWVLDSDSAATVLKLKILHPGIKVLLTGGYGTSASLPPGVAGYLPKPYLPKDLIRVVRHALRSGGRSAAA